MKAKKQNSSFRQSHHKSCLCIFGHNRGGFQEKIRRRTMWRGIAAPTQRRSRQMGGTAGIFSEKAGKFAGKACADICDDTA